MRGSAAARLLGLRVRIPPGAWMSVTCTCCCRGLCVGQITRTGESYRLWCAYLSVIITKLMVGFRDYANAPKKKKWCYYTDSNNTLLFRAHTFRTFSGSATWKWRRSHYHCELWITEILVSMGILFIMNPPQWGGLGPLGLLRYGKKNRGSAYNKYKDVRTVYIYMYIYTIYIY